MPQPGMQRNGLLLLPNGQYWNPADPLPAEDTSAFNSLPMGSPLNGLGTMAPTAVPPSPLPSMSQPVPSAPPSAPPTQGMFGNRTPMSVNIEGQQTQLQDPSLGLPSPSNMSSLPAPYPSPSASSLLPTPVPKPGFFQKGGLGGHLLDGVTAFANTELASQGNPLGLAWVKQQQDDRDARTQATQESASQIQKIQQFLMEQEYKRLHPEAGTVEKNYNFLSGLDPSLGKNYASQVSAGPPILATVNGQPTLLSRSSVSGSGGYQKPTVDWAGAAAHLRQNPGLASQFDEMFGEGAAKAVLGQ